MTEEDTVEKGYRITGKVQGVFYRAWTQSLARDLGLDGTVRNRRDGSVEVQVRGSRAAVADFEDRLWEGPPAARVDGVEPGEAARGFAQGEFEILPTV